MEAIGICIWYLYWKKIVETKRDRDFVQGVSVDKNGVSVYYTIILFPNIGNHVEISK